MLHAGTLHVVTRAPARVPLAGAAAGAPLELENKFALLAEMAGDDASASTPLRQASFPVSQLRARLKPRLRLSPTLTLTPPRSLTLIPNPLQPGGAGDDLRDGGRTLRLPRLQPHGATDPPPADQRAAARLALCTRR